ncbi:RNA-binding S4 domain-containing protein [Helicobacter pametensis]|uniref:RNA-binding S4 domain-containing protein n=1 Tax=Helicobacter pametensis TaxID=95149 RepID=UPI0004823320|nr:RNA-binding S4 domain-containing protein [Helicobacter pametensis]
MRLDKFLNSTNLLKRRSVAQDMCEHGAVLLNAHVAKSSKEVKVGDEITLVYLDHQERYRVLALPQTKTIPKSQTHLYVKKED